VGRDGTSFEMTPYSGDEIITLNPQNTSFSTVSGLKTIFSTIYHHILNQNKAPFETWLKQISAYDIDCLLFGIYAASFKDTNYVTYECPNPKCKKIFLEKKDIMDMVVFPNDESEKRFKQILAKDTVSNQIRGKVQVTYLTDQSCKECYDVSIHDKALTNLGVPINNIKRIDISSDEGKGLVSKYKIKAVPTLLISGEVSEYQSLVSVWKDVGTIASDGTYVFTELSVMNGVYKDLVKNKIVTPTATK
jgi:hypothetical protein